MGTKIASFPLNLTEIKTRYKIRVASLPKRTNSQNEADDPPNFGQFHFLMKNPPKQKQIN